MDKNLFDEFEDEEIEAGIVCTYCYTPKLADVNKWLFCKDVGYACPVCQEKKNIKPMIMDDLLIKYESKLDIDNPKAIGGMVESWVALDLDGEIVAKGNTEKQCIKNAEAYLKQGVFIEK